MYLLPFAPSGPGHNEVDRVCRESAALRRRLVEGAWAQDAENRMGDFFSPEVRDILPPPVLSRNAALQIWSQIAALYDDAPTVSVAGSPDLSPIITPELWPMRQQSHLLQVAANECLMRVDIEDGGILYRVVPADTVILRAYAHRPDSAAPFNPTRSQPARVEECRLRIDPSGIGECWTWEIWDISDPAAPTFQILSQSKLPGLDGKEIDGWTDMTAAYAGYAGWPDDYRDVEGRPVLPYVLYHRRIGDHLRDPLTGRELVSGTLDSAALWTMWFAAVRDSSHPQRYIIDGAAAVNATTSAGRSGVMSSDVVRASPQFILQIHGIRRGDGYSSPNAGQFQPGADPGALGASIEAYEAGLSVSAGLSPSDVQRGTSGASGYALVISQQGRRDVQKKLIPPCTLGDRLLLSKAAALLQRPDLPTDPAAWSISYGMIGISPDEVLKEQAVIKEDLALGLTSRRAAIAARNQAMNREQIDALILEIDAQSDHAEDMADDDAALTDLLTRAAASSPEDARTLIADALAILGAEEEAEDMPPGSDYAG